MGGAHREAVQASSIYSMVRVSNGSAANGERAFSVWKMGIAPPFQNLVAVLVVRVFLCVFASLPAVSFSRAV